MTYKADWVTGDILTAAQQNALAEQAVSRFADASARDAAITSPSEGQACWLNDTNEFQIYDGSSWKPLLDTDTFSVSGGNYTISTDLTVSGDVTIQTLDMDTIVEGDVIYGSGADTLARLAKGSDDEVLTLASGVPSWAAVPSWSGSTANGLATYGSSSSIVAESTATYDGTTLELTQSGGGLKMDGLASADANTLDDYEEGLWTAAFDCGTSGTITINSSYDQGAYTKIGRLVTVSGEFYISATSSPVGTFYIEGLPFACADLDERAGRTAMYCAAYGMTLDWGPTFSYISEGWSKIEINYRLGGTSGGGTNQAGNIDTGSIITVGGSYFAAT